MDEYRDIQVAAHGMEQVVTALAITVAVAGDGKYPHVVVGQMDGLGDGQRPSMKAVERIAACVMGELAGLAYTRDDGELMRLDAEGHHCHFERPEDLQVATTRAPGGILSAEVFQLRHEAHPAPATFQAAPPAGMGGRRTC